MPAAQAALRGGLELSGRGYVAPDTGHDARRRSLAAHDADRAAVAGHVSLQEWDAASPENHGAALFCALAPPCISCAAKRFGGVGFRQISRRMPKKQQIELASGLVTAADRTSACEARAAASVFPPRLPMTAVRRNRKFGLTMHTVELSSADLRERQQWSPDLGLLAATDPAGRAAEPLDTAVLPVLFEIRLRPGELLQLRLGAGAYSSRMLRGEAPARWGRGASNRSGPVASWALLPVDESVRHPLR